MAIADQKVRFAPAAVFVVSFATCLVFVFFVLPPAQFNKYTLAAQLYLANRLAPERLLDFSPLYFYLNVGLKMVAAEPGFWLHLLHFAFIAAAATFLYSLVAGTFGPLPAVAASLGFVLERSVICYTQVFEPEPLMTVLVLGFVWFVLRPSPRSHLAAGCLLGLCYLTRPNFLPVAVIVPVHFFLNRGRIRWIRSSVLFLVPVVLCMGLLWGRNFVVMGRFWPAVMNPGTAFFEGNNPLSWGFGSVHPRLVDELALSLNDEPDPHHEAYRQFVRRILGPDASVRDVNGFWSRKALAFLQDHPGHALRLFQTKLFHFFHGYNWHSLGNGYWSDQKLKTIVFPTVPFGLLSSLALLGMIVARNQFRNNMLLYAILFSQLLFDVVFYASARQRVSVVPFFAYFAAAALKSAMDRRNRAWIILLPSAALAVLFLRPTDLMKEEDHLWHGIRASDAYRSASFQFRNDRKWPEAADAASLSLAAAPWLMDSRRPADVPFKEPMALGAVRKIRGEDASFRLDAGMLLLDAGRYKEAQETLKDLAALYEFKRDQYQSSQPQYFIARAFLAQGDRKAAEQELQSALESSPGDPYVLSLLAALTGEAQYRNQVLKYFDEIDARFYLGKALLGSGRAADAVADFAYVAEKLPESRQALVYLAAALGDSGQRDEAVKQYTKALRMGADPALLEEHIVPVFRDAAAKRPGDSAALFSYGFVLRQFGHFREALDVQKEALRLAQDSAIIRSEIDALEKALRN